MLYSIEPLASLTQMVVQNSDDTAKELLAVRQEALRLQRQAMAETEASEESSAAENVSSIYAMRQHQT